MLPSWIKKATAFETRANLLRMTVLSANMCAHAFGRTTFPKLLFEAGTFEKLWHKNHRKTTEAEVKGIAKTS